MPWFVTLIKHKTGGRRTGDLLRRDGKERSVLYASPNT